MAQKRDRKPDEAAKPVSELAAAEIVINPETGAVLHAKNADVQRDPASLTKLMTAYMVMRAVERGQISLDQQIRISEGASKLDNNTLNVPVTRPDGTKEVLDTIPAGSRMTVREALTVMMTSSANGVAKALGEALAPPKVNAAGKTVPGSERDFAREMTRVARDELGMSSSTFINASGLNNGGADQKSNISTARDMAVLAQRTMKDFPKYEQMLYAHTATTNIILPDGQKLRVNSPTTNHFVRDFGPRGARADKEGFHAVGPQKTGFNRLSGAINLLSTAENGEGVRLTSVVLGGKDSDRRYAANLRNLRSSYAKVDADPQQYAAVYKGGVPAGSTYALLSPTSAFAEAAGSRRKKEDTRLAQTEPESAARRFNRVNHGEGRQRSPKAVPVSYQPERQQRRHATPAAARPVPPADQVGSGAAADVRLGETMVNMQGLEEKRFSLSTADGSAAPAAAAPEDAPPAIKPAAPSPEI